MKLYTRRKWIIYIVIALCMLLSSVFFLRTYLLRSVIKKIAHRFEVQYKAKLIVKEASFIGIRDFYLKDISFSKNEGDTICSVDSIYIKVRVLPLLMGRVQIDYFFVDRPTFSFIYKGDELKKELNTTAPVSSTRHYSSYLNQIVRLLFYSFPMNGEVYHFAARYRHKDYKASCCIDQWLIRDGKMEVNVNVVDNARKGKWKVKAAINQNESLCNIKVYSMPSNTHVELPVLADATHTLIGFDTLQLVFYTKTHHSSSVELSGSGKVKKMILKHPKIADQSIRLDMGELYFVLKAGSHFIELDSSSHVIFNKLSYHPYLYYQSQDPRQLIVKVLPFECKAVDFFSSLPEGLCPTVEGIKVRGDLSYRLAMNLNFDHPEEMTFSSVFRKKNFAIDQFGKVDFRMINTDFTYMVYEKDTAQRSFVVGSSNSDYVPLASISPYLKNAVITAEDGDFYQHKGFYEEAFRQAIITNLKKGRFARGASTITMQLVKNVFLNRKKVLSRKLEEILIVWIIENMNLVTKDRLLEVYLNVIEWGPGIYGIKQASYYYFKKQPHELSLAESIYLSLIIPKPGKFATVFTSTGALKPYYSSYFNHLVKLMVSRDRIGSTDTVGVKPFIQLKGPARYKIESNIDTLNQEVDSVLFIDDMI